MKSKYKMFFTLWYFFAAFFIISVNLSNANRNTIMSEKLLNYRLPATTKPSKYELTLTIDLNDFYVAGLTEIYLTVLEETNIIALNYKDLEFDENGIKLYKLNDDGENEGEVETFNSLVKHDELEIFELNYEQLTVGEYLLQIPYSTIIGDDLKGIYRSSYFKDGEKR